MTLKNTLGPAAGIVVALSLTACSATIKPHASSGAMNVDERHAQADRLIAQATEMVHADRIDQAIDLYKQAVSLYSNDAFAWYNLGVLCNRQRRLAESAEAWNMAATLDARDPRPYFALGLQLQEQGWLHDAAESYNRSLERDPNYLPALKKSVEVDQYTDNYSDVTLDRIRRALLQENQLEPDWVKYLRLMQIKTQERVSRSGGNAGH